MQQILLCTVSSRTRCDIFKTDGLDRKGSIGSDHSDSEPEMPWNRVHSRIPDRRELNDIVPANGSKHKVPASFMTFKQHQYSGSMEMESEERKLKGSASELSEFVRFWGKC